MKLAIVLSFILTIPIWSPSQSMAAIYKLLPSTCTPELNAKDKTILLKNKEYIKPGEDSGESVTYTIDINEKKNYLSYEYDISADGGQLGFLIFEIRKFIKTGGGSLIVFSQYGGTRAAYAQQEIDFFEIYQNKLVQLKEELLPANIEYKFFIKQKCLDSSGKQALMYSSSAYDLNPENKNEILFRINLIDTEDENKKCFWGDQLAFKWTGRSFTKGKMKK